MTRLKICDWDRQEGRTTFVVREILDQMPQFKSIAVVVPTLRSQKSLLDAIKKSEEQHLVLDHWVKVSIYHIDGTALRGARPECFIFDDADLYLDQVKANIIMCKPELAVVVGKFSTDVRKYLSDPQ